MSNYQIFTDRDLRYLYDDWSNTGLASRLRHHIEFRAAKDEEGTWIDLDAMAFDSWMLDMETWCNDNIGVVGVEWHCTRHQYTFYFKDIESAAAFKLCWG